MGSQTAGCNCCKCKDCSCKVIIDKGGGKWLPAPVIECKKNTSHGRFIFQDSCDCRGYNCDVQVGCTVSKICLSHTYLFIARVWGQLEALRSGFHIGKIEYRKIGCAANKSRWKQLVRVESKGTGQECCKFCVRDVCKFKLPRGKYEFRFTADSVDGIDHCNNYLQYDMIWCRIPKNTNKTKCKLLLPDEPECSELCCSGSKCGSPCFRRNENDECEECSPAPECNIVSCDSISLV